MRRWILVLLSVAALSALIARAERSAGATSLPTAEATDWVRTADGWEPRAVLTATPPSKPFPLHPGLVAAMQMGASLVVLLAFPGRTAPVSSAASRRSL